MYLPLSFKAYLLTLLQSSYITRESKMFLKILCFTPKKYLFKFLYSQEEIEYEEDNSPSAEDNLDNSRFGDEVNIAFLLN